MLVKLQELLPVTSTLTTLLLVRVWNNYIGSDNVLVKIDKLVIESSVLTTLQLVMV